MGKSFVQHRFASSDRYSTGTVINPKGRSCTLILRYKDGDRWKQIQKGYTLPEDDASKTIGKAKAESALIEWQQEAEQEYSASLEAHQAVGMTVTECVELYLSDGLEKSIHRSTESHYRGMLRRNIAPTIGKKALADLTKQDVRNWVDALDARLSRSVVENTLRLLRAALDYASDDEQGYVKTNVARKVRPQKQDVSEHHVPNALTDQEQARVIATVDAALNSPDGYRDLPGMLAIKIALLSGLRRSEVCALKWKCVDFKTGTIKVELSIGHTDNEFYLKDPKSKSSARTVECPESLMQDLKRRQAAMKEQCVNAGIPFDREMFVIGGIDGSFTKPPRLDDRWRPLANSLALKGTQNKPVTFHCLRHTYATVLIQAKVDIVTVSRLMGHSNPSITLDRYGSTGKEAMRRAANTLGETIAATVREYENAGEILEIGKTGTEDR